MELPRGESAATSGLLNRLPKNESEAYDSLMVSCGYYSREVEVIEDANELRIMYTVL